MNFTAWTVQTEKSGIREALVLVTGRCDEQDGTAPPLLANVLLDRSGSMKGAPLAAAIEAVHALVERASPQDHLGLLSFDGQVEQPVAPRAMDEAGKAAFKRALAQVHSGRGTALHRAIEVGVEALGRIFVHGARPKLLVLTDGEPSVGPQEPGQFGALAEKFAAAGIGIHALGLAQHYVPEILAALTQPSGNGFEHADGPDGLPVALGALSATLYGELVTDVSVQVETTGFRSLSCRHPLPSAPVDSGLRVTLGGLGLQQLRRVLFAGKLEAQEWSVKVTVGGRGREGRRQLAVPVQRAWLDSVEGELVVATSAELQLVVAETAAWKALASKDFSRSDAQLVLAEEALRQLTGLGVKEIPIGRHLERIADLRRSVERRAKDVPLGIRRAASASSSTHISQLVGLPKAKA